MTSINNRFGVRERRRMGIVVLCSAALTACGGGDTEAVVVPLGAPIIAAQPVAASANFGAGASFRVDVSGTGLTYQWQLSTDNGVTWVDVANAIAAIYELAVVDLSYSGYLYRAVVSSGTSTVTTATAKLTVAHAPLASRLNGAAFYQPQLNITVLSNANLPASLTLGVSGIAGDGTMTWPAAQAWIAALNASNYLGHNDWRLPRVTPINGTGFVVNNLPGDSYGGYSGKIDLGYGISAPGTSHSGSAATELPFLFYNALGNLAKFSPTGVAQNIAANGYAPLSNVASGNYWTSQPYGATGAYAFDMQNGNQNAYVSDASGWRFNVMVVRSGDTGS